MKPVYEKTPRIEVVDALRGFAVMAIILVHCIEHFHYMYYPTDSPSWLNARPWRGQYRVLPFCRQGIRNICSFVRIHFLHTNKQSKEKRKGLRLPLPMAHGAACWLRLA